MVIRLTKNGNFSPADKKILTQTAAKCSTFFLGILLFLVDIDAVAANGLRVRARIATQVLLARSNRNNANYNF